ncbi:SMC-like protein Sph2 [Candidatus Halobonum tyrrellensis G22]|uniref:SMC-like protein Sph2 n=1 Tax=Candidatus Halobonum tyrrellensis G22 TaxID=1324957 RepID=V4H8D9_9EURY|nr:SMC-like protein Sph2 [Candidatus Halobonum tyrrellensis G22]
MRAENIGGIDSTELTLSSGVTVLSGRNATNRTSFLQALMAGLGGDQATLKRDADEGRVELEFDGETYTRTLTRGGDGVVMGGDPYLDDATTAELFAFLLESNEARQVVERAGDLREVIMRPVDTDAIQAEVSRLTDERQDVDSRLDSLESLADRLPDLERRRTSLREQIEEKETELADKETEIEEADAEVEESRSEQVELEETLEELRDVRSSLEDVRFDIETERQSIEGLEDDLAEYESELADLPETPAGNVADLEDDIERLRSRERDIESTLNRLQRVVQFNEEMLDGSETELQSVVEGSREGDGSVTDSLVEGETVTCWTCGSEVDPGRIEETLDVLRETAAEKRAERNEVREELDEIESDRSQYERQQRERDRLERRISETESELDRRRDRIPDLEDERDDLHAEIEELESTVDELEGADQSPLLDLHREANQLEFEIERLEGEVEDVDAEIDDIESQLDERDDLEARREEIGEELTDLRTRIDRIERSAVDEFNEQMATVLDILDYENLDRVWIERRETTRQEGRRKVETTVFDLHVIRSTGDGTTYEDTIDHLSESEREVIGLVFALAGYLVHEAYEEVPFVLLDSLEAIDSERIADLVDYFGEYADYLVVALLPEDAAAVDDRHERVAPA